MIVSKSIQYAKAKYVPVLLIVFFTNAIIFSKFKKKFKIYHDYVTKIHINVRIIYRFGRVHLSGIMTLSP